MSALVQPRAARRLIAAATAAIALLALLLALIVATLMGGLAPPSTCGPGAGKRYAPSSAALADIPGNYLQGIRQAGDRYSLDWAVLAGIYSIETDFGRLDAPGVQSGENSAGAGGPGQFLEPTWRLYGVDGDGDGDKDRYNPADAIPATANLLRRSGAPADYPRAIFAYNHASWYVDDVLARAARYRGAAEADPESAQAALVADASARTACAELVGAGGPADLNRAVRLTFPAAYRALPAWAMAGGRPPQAVDARIYGNVVWLCAATSCALPRRARPVTTLTVTAPPSTSRRRRPPPSTTGTPAPAGSLATSAGRPAAGAPGLDRRASLGRRSNGSGTTATPATARRERAPATARRTSMSRGSPAATAPPRSWHPARGSWRSLCRERTSQASGVTARNRRAPQPSPGLTSRARCAGERESRRAWRCSRPVSRSTSVGFPSERAASLRRAGLPSPLLPPHIPHERGLGCSTELPSTLAGADPAPRRDTNRGRAMRDPSALTTADVEAIASRVAELLRHESRLGHHVGTTAVATMLGVSGDWVREHAAELGAIRVGDGAKGALRFDVKRVKDALEQRRLGRPNRARRRRPGPARRSVGVELLPLPNDAR